MVALPHLRWDALVVGGWVDSNPSSGLICFQSTPVAHQPKSKGIQTFLLQV